MKKKIFVVYGTEDVYVMQMVERLTDMLSSSFDLYGYTSYQEMMEFFKSREEKIEIALICEELIIEEEFKEYVEEYYILAGDVRVTGDTKLAENVRAEGNAKQTENAQNYIFKYQSVDGIIKSIMSHYAETHKGNTTLVSHKRRMKIIGIFTPIGRSLQTTFALTLGQILARRGKCLYLNFEMFSGFSILLNRDFQADMSDLLYYFQNTPDKLPLKFANLIQNVNGLDFVPPVLSYTDLQEVESEEWERLFETIEACTDYEYLILDLSEQQKCLLELLTKCDQIYTIVRNDRIAQAKIHQYEQLLGMMDCEEVKARTRKVNLPIFKELPVNIEQYTYGDLSTYIKQMLEEGEGEC